ncbi:hypothetical protein BT63DRAFT_451024 [Microthyrium microscopicum]|uniref:Uncharacterized protein n=1 Tax=Microthyrium microscopicum TaxID=703497 RepID=A0A6A6UMS8_9PEZI|nr:hypothetical protein BT63DRAFT_451024 [Microthyrium microscopicum]
MQDLDSYAPGEEAPFHEALYEFQEFIDSHQEQGIRPSQDEWSTVADQDALYVPINALRSFFETHNLRRIVDAVFRNNDNQDPVALKEISAGSIKIFSILLCINKGSWIKHFLKHPNLADANLPFDGSCP